MDEEMKNAEQAANEMKNEGAGIFDQLKGMLDEATKGEGNVFDKLKGVLEGKDGEGSIFDKAKEMFDGKDGEAGVLDQLKDMLDKGTTAAGEVSQDFLEKAKAALPADKKIAIYCRSGRRSANAATRLAAEGYQCVNLKGGILAWKDSGQPVQTD